MPVPSSKTSLLRFRFLSFRFPIIERDRFVELLAKLLGEGGEVLGLTREFAVKFLDTKHN